MRHALPAALAAAALAAPAFGAVETVVITVVPTSTVDMTICHDLPLIGGCDDAMSALTGTATFRVDTDANTAELLDFAVTTTDALVYQYSGFNSSATATADQVDVYFDQPTPAGPVAIGAGGAIEFADVTMNLAGDANVVGNIFLVGAVEEMISLGDFGPFVSTLSGTLVDDGNGTYTLAASFSFDETAMGTAGDIPVTTTVTGMITLDGAGSAAVDCPADIDSDGDADPDDISAFVNAFTDADPSNADVDNDGDEDPDDIAAFVAAFVAGC